METCCRAALHRLFLAGACGRPGELADGPCLRRLLAEGSCQPAPSGRFAITADGLARHAEVVLTRPS